LFGLVFGLAGVAAEGVAVALRVGSKATGDSVSFSK